MLSLAVAVSASLAAAQSPAEQAAAACNAMNFTAKVGMMRVSRVDTCVIFPMR